MKNLAIIGMLLSIFMPISQYFDMPVISYFLSGLCAMIFIYGVWHYWPIGRLDRERLGFNIYYYFVAAWFICGIISTYIDVGAL
ncbi:hypothetical protein QWY75_00260 [Pontixanthobacter aestiaquae]|uniref:Uncharacterized protein n=1 Tax=Pontixanthobacter aestiaquae TaxID=1509367 RepID=A0A844ZB76_9SPHN|nr:hypothetical protein [Pontixanthobacter aestiaquae]MDN3644630.1 hypothetical protein [Pontixanthobacter aestiaquae]MXO84363.1 hypothetical protein [Pontixanthobacter aestiaquae]